MHQPVRQQFCFITIFQIAKHQKKIVNLAALKLAKNAERIENQKKKDEQHAKIVKNTLIAVVTIAILAMAAWAIRYFRKNKKQG